MSTFNHRIRAVVAGTLVTLAMAAPVLADDAEIYSSQANSSGAKPNVLFIMDTSGSMDTDVQISVPAYNPNTSYTGSCDSNYYYWSRNSDTPPTCSTSQRVKKSSFKCAAAATALADKGIGVYPGLFNPREKFAQYHVSSSDKTKGYWETSSWNDSSTVECVSDEGKDGYAAGDGSPYLRNSDSSRPYSATSKGVWSGLSATYRFFNANYMNYVESSPPGKMTRLEIVRDVAVNLASSLQNVNLGLMRYSTDAQGGYVMSPIGDIDKNRTDILTKLNSFDPKDGSGGTPLSETLYEAALYLTGRTVDYGAKSQPGKSTSTTAVSGGKYVSPIQYSCQKNYIVYLTDGAPTVDDDANSKIASMIGKSSCAADTSPPAHDSGWTTYSGVCMDDLAAWLNSDSTDLNPSSDVPGNQTALTYMIGFGDSVASSVPYLNMIAKAGGTDKAYTAADVSTLTNALQQIFSSIQEDSSTFVTPSISVNAFNRAQTDQDLYFSLFRASNKPHWPGNLKKYKLAQDQIVDVNNSPAVGADGFFAPDAKSYWSPTKDGADVTTGGAVSMQDLPANRVIYTQLGAKKLPGDAKNLLNTSNTALTDAVVGTGTDTTACSLACQNAINWLRGVDVNDDNKDGKTDDQHKFMGDPLHGRPAVVPYGKLSDGVTEDVTVFVPTNDGLLHAIGGLDDTSKGGGKELWAFMPPELLGRLGPISQTASVTSRTYGLDGDIRVLRMDKNQNGVVDSDDRVWLFFGMRMGGNHYYALDVTDRANPKLMWNIGPSELPQLGQTWSAPVVARVNVKNGNDDAEKFVLIFGGGYDTAQETQGYSVDSVGNRIFMVDAQTGKLLWFAGSTANSGSSPQPDLKLDDATTGSSVKTMNNSIPARVNVIDTNGDLFADRMYVGDMGGRVWRFDITNGEDRAKLVAGGVIAQLGQGGAATAIAANNRRFYNAADVAIIQLRGQDPYYNIAIGSGYRGHPLDTQTQERFYSLRDPQPYAQMTQEQYDDYEPILNSDLVDVTSSTTTVKNTDKGWRLNMYAAGKWVGEKVLSESVTANNTVMFTSFEPSILGSSKGACFPSTTNRAYAISVISGRATLDFNDDGEIDDSDRSTELNQEGIVGDIQVALQRSDENPSCNAGDPNCPPVDPNKPKTICLAGMQVLKKCVGTGGTVRTFWNRTDAK